MPRECAKYQCDNPRKDGHETCEEHPPLVDHGLTPNETVCPECGEVGAGTLHDDLWYCREGCGELFDPYEVAGVEKEPRWNPE